jgi:hypothetical protein
MCFFDRNVQPPSLRGLWKPLNPHKRGALIAIALAGTTAITPTYVRGDTVASVKNDSRSKHASVVKTQPAESDRKLLAQSRQEQAIGPVLQDPAARKISIDFTHGAQLKGAAERGYVIYHGQANDYGLRHNVLPAIAKVPPGSTLLLDIEDWLEYPDKVPYYADAPDAQALRYLKGYAKLLRDATPALKARQITLGVYEVPTALWRNWNHVRRDNEANYQRWLANQKRVLLLAEKSDFLPALRDAGGFVCVQAYVPEEWLRTPFAAHWLSQVIPNMSKVLDDGNVPHRYLFRTAGGNGVLYRVMIEKAKWKADWWEERRLPKEAATVRTLLKLSN